VARFDRGEAVRDDERPSSQEGERSAREPSGSRASTTPSGIRVVLQTLRSVPEKLRRPESLLMIMALFASLGAHMPPYIGLGALAAFFESKEREEARQAPVEISFEVSETPAPEAKPEEEKAKPEDARPEERAKPKLEVAKKEPEPEKKPDLVPPKKEEEEKQKVVVSKVEVEPPPPPPSPERKQSITQKSEDPNVEPPPDAKYLAEESRRVAEETMATVTSETRDDPVPQAAAPVAAGDERAGEDLQKDERGAEQGAETDEPPQMASVSRPEQGPPPSEAAQRPEVSAREAVKATPAQPTIVQDPLGSFVLAPAAPAREGREGQQGQQGTAGKAGPNLKVSWRTFEDTFGARELAQDRMPREAKRRGAGREKRWEEFRAAIENYIVGVKPGNQTALNAAADPFAAYLAAFHRNLHMEFAHEFLESLPALGDLGNPDLVTKVEIVVNSDGTLDRVGVVKSSGNLMYDFGAFNAVQRGSPYPPPPEKIRSPDGRVYMRWALHRNESQCGTWNAEPYILKNPPRSPHDPKPDNVPPYNSPSEPMRPPAAPGTVPRAGETMGMSEPRRSPLDRTGPDTLAASLWSRAAL
jgi:TonB family protein